MRSPVAKCTYMYVGFVHVHVARVQFTFLLMYKLNYSFVKLTQSTKYRMEVLIYYMYNVVIFLRSCSLSLYLDFGIWRL